MNSSKNEEKINEPSAAWTWSPDKKVIVLSSLRNLEWQNFYQMNDYSVHLDGLGCLALLRPEKGNENGDEHKVRETKEKITILPCSNEKVSIQKWFLIPQVVSQ